MMEVHIEKGVPIPESSHRRTKWPLNKMAIGDSFTFNIEQKNTVSASVSRYRKLVDSKSVFTMRTVSATKVRLWRVS